METEQQNDFDSLCLHFGLGSLLEKPIAINGGLLHKMLKVHTDRGCYAIKCLNPSIMSRETALSNMNNSEKIADVLKENIPAITARKINGAYVHHYEGHYYMSFDWFDGITIYPPQISKKHCGVIGDIIGIIHSLNVSVDGVHDEQENSSYYSWNELLETARVNEVTWLSIYEESLGDIIKWTEKVVNAKVALSKHKVISHKDLDPKNVMWQGNCPYIIDWEAAGYVNPYQELLEVVNYWANDGSSGLNKELFLAVINHYKTHKSIENVDWNVVFDSGYEGMLGWLEYNIKRALGIEVSCKDEIIQGEKLLIGTITELKYYQEKLCIMRAWLNDGQ